ncbi:MAG: hypothetical protein HZA31_02935 [Opitutae bacterium]|nr:hypothetical protein [Opitutae bacterium]
MPRFACRHSKRRLFGGGRSEKLDVTQRQLAFAEVEAARAAVEQKTETIVYERSQTREPRRTPAETFAHVPVTETVEIVPAAVQQAPALYERIGEERTFEIDLVPARLVKRELGGSGRPVAGTDLPTHASGLDGRQLPPSRRDADPL